MPFTYFKLFFGECVPSASIWRVSMRYIQCCTKPKGSFFKNWSW